MARDGSGTFSLPEAPFVYDTVISETAVNNNFSDIANGITQSLSKDGQTVPTANLPMGGYKHTGVANASGRTDYAAAGQVQDSAFQWCGTAGGTANALTLTPTPAITAYAAGQTFRFKSGASANTGATTVAISGLTAIAIQANGAACTGGEIAADKWYEITLSDTSTAQLKAFSVSQAASETVAGVAELATQAEVTAGTDDARIITPLKLATRLSSFSSGALTVTAGEALSDRDLCYLDDTNQRGGGIGKAYKVDADATGPVRIGRRLCIALAAISSGATGSAQVADGTVTGLSGLTSGMPVYASATAGALTQTPPAIPADGTQIASRLVGFATSTTAIWFAPDNLTTFAKYAANAASAASITVEHFTDSGNAERVARSYVAAAVYGSDIAGSGILSTPGAIFSGSLANTVDDNTATGLLWNINRSSAVGSNAKWKVDYGVGVTKEIRFVRIFNAASGNAIASWKLQYSDNDSTYTDAATIDTSSASAWTSDVTFATVGAHRYWQIIPGTNGVDGAAFGFNEVELKEYSTSRKEPVTIGSEFINSTATDRVTVKFTGASDANADTMTTFYNRTGSARDLIAEVTL